MTRDEYGTDGNIYQMSISNGKEYTSEDAVSREAVTDTIIWYENGGMIGTKELLELIRRLPSVQPTKKGRWILDREISIVFSVFRCSNCKSIGANEHFNFCPNCGAKMEGESE